MQQAVQCKNIQTAADGSDDGIHIMGGQIVVMWRRFDCWQWGVSKTRASNYR